MVIVMGPGVPVVGLMILPIFVHREEVVGIRGCLPPTGRLLIPGMHTFAANKVFFENSKEDTFG